MSPSTLIFFGVVLCASLTVVAAQLAKCKVTTADVIGPYYKANAPIRKMGSSGAVAICANSDQLDRLFINGTVRRVASNNQCGAPVKAKLEIWQANYVGTYSDKSPASPDFSCRASVITQPNGFYSFQSIMPGRYDDGGLRPAHVHYRITQLDSADRPVGNPLVTQLYFAGDRYLYPKDSCGTDCHSMDPTLITNVRLETDVKTYGGSWDILLK